MNETPYQPEHQPEHQGEYPQYPQYSQYPPYGSPYDPQYPPPWPLVTPGDVTLGGAQLGGAQLGGAQPGGAPLGAASVPAAAQADPGLRRRRIRFTVGAAAVLAAVCATAVAVAATSSSTSGTGLALPSTNQQQYAPQQQSPFGGFFPGGTGSGNSGSGSGSTGNGSTGSGSGSTSSGTATSAQSAGVVVINTVLGYQGARAAGTGMVVTSNGEILTNNHVVAGATSIQVTVSSTGKTYSASVVGTDPTDDVAVIQLQDASGLTKANFGDSASVKVGDAVTGVGNAGGTGSLTSATGHVSALDQTITASDENGQNAERVSNLIQSDAPIAAGDSGGPLYDSSGNVVGIDTAAQTGRSGSTIAAYSIPIDKALGIASDIEAGKASSTIHIGLTGFIGVSVQDATGGAGIASVVTAGPAAKAGITAGDVITAVNGTAIANSTALHNALLKTKPGQSVKLTWTDQSGATHSATLTLIAGPAD